MMNLLGWEEFIGACSSESERFQQPIKVAQARDVDNWRAKGHRRADSRIHHPGSKGDRHTRFSVNDDDPSSRAPFGV
jgi:hypothetical protein